MRRARRPLAHIALLASLALGLLGAECYGVESPWLHQHVLDRIGFGPDPWSRARIDELGARLYILEQLRPRSIADPELEARLRDYPRLTASYAELLDGRCPACDALADPEAPLRDSVEAKILRSIFSRRQLEAVLEDFWFDHFNVDASRGLATPGLIPYLRDAIRPHVLGDFGDMLLAVARSPAMLEYLDSRRNVVPGTVGGDGIVRGINENYARELLELHTVGVEAGYSQKDVREVARAFTGWSTDAEGFRFHPGHHDSGRKRIMGALRIPRGGGVEDGEAVLSFLAAHPATAERVSRLLVRRFVSEDPPPRLVRRAARKFERSGGNLGGVVRVILMSEEFWDPRYYGVKVKRPAVLLASAVRATGGVVGANLVQMRKDLAALGEAPYQAAAPTGYPDDSEHWASAGTFLRRLELVRRIARKGGVEWGVEGDPPLVASLLLGDRLFAAGWMPPSLVEVHAFLRASAGAHERVRMAEAGGLLLSSPEFFQH